MSPVYMPRVPEPHADDEPLHGLELAEDEWWGCAEPERRHDIHEIWDERCPKCRMRIRLVIATEGDVMMYEAHEPARAKGTLASRLASLEERFAEGLDKAPAAR